MPYRDPEKARESNRNTKRKARERKHLEKYGHLEDMRGRHGNQGKGARCGRWKGGVTLSSHGYRKVHVGKGHLLADSNGYAYEHLLVWVSAGNPKPPDGQVLHHRNGDKTDNRLENLALLTNEEHLTEHARKRLGSGPRPGMYAELPDEGVVQEWPR